jgi:predicted nucleic acid-binding protein
LILLDTNVMSELMKAKPDPAVERWFLLNEDECAIASVAVGELAYGVAKLDDGARKARLAEQVAEWRFHFAARSHAFTMTTALIYGDILAKARRTGRPMSVADAQIAAIATEQACSLATRNISDFAALDVSLINPWGEGRVG